MKKLFTFLAGAALLGSLSACSSDEPAKGPEKGGETPNGDGAYLAVRIIGDNVIGRSTTDGGYEFGSPDEHMVNNAKFFFFDEFGKYVLEAKIVNNPTTSDPAANQDNVELNVTSVLVLDKLTEQGKLPTYMLTVINCPDILDVADPSKPKPTLDEVLSLTTNWTKSITEEGKDEPTNLFVMSTSSYSNPADVKNHDDVYYYATKIDPDLYQSNPEDAKKDNNTVNVYVERLAAKVDFNVDITDKSKIKEVEIDGKSHTLYEITSSVVGGPNEGEVDATTKLYIEILDWNLGGITETSYLSKNIDINWSFTNWVPSGNGIYWNDPTRYRSFWGKSTVYGSSPVNLSYADSKHLYPTSNTLYCNENTNSPDKIFVKDGKETTAVNPEYVTHATIHARVCNESGVAIPMVMANGVLHKQDEYIKKIMGNYLLDEKNKINIYIRTKNVEGEDGSFDREYKEIDYTYFSYFPEKTTDNKVGQTIFKFDDTSKTGIEKEYYYYDATSTEKDKYKRLEGENLTSAIAALNEGIIEEQHVFVGQERYATIYDGGNFVYYIPIEHLGAKAGNTEVTEGYYGVVRNHWYQLTIESFSQVGHGIWDPEKYEETYKPDGPQEYYYLGARINILSWKLVKQSVSL